jgi:hypothetical protein
VDSQLHRHVGFTITAERGNRRIVTLQGTPPSSTYLHRSKAPHTSLWNITTTRDSTGFQGAGRTHFFS